MLSGGLDRGPTPSLFFFAFFPLLRFILAPLSLLVPPVFSTVPVVLQAQSLLKRAELRGRAARAKNLRIWTKTTKQPGGKALRVI